MCFTHVHTKFQLSSFIRSGAIADLLLGVFFSKMPFFQKNAVFIYKSKSAISLLLIKLESWNLVCICTKYIFFSSSNFIALTLAVWRWHDFKNFKRIFKIGAQIFLTCTYHYHDLHDFKYLYANFQALFQKSRVCSISCINRLDYFVDVTVTFWFLKFLNVLLFFFFFFCRCLNCW